MTVVLYKSEKVFGSDSALTLPRHEMPSPWRSGGGDAAHVDERLLPKASAEVTWSLGVDDIALWFTCAVNRPAVCDVTRAAGEFVEGLWNSDVAEIFLLDPDSGEYQEFNISPMGAWWTCTFRSYRQRNLVNRKPGTLCSLGNATEDGWEIVFGVRLDELAVKFSSDVQMHVATISHNDDGSPRYFSSHPIRGTEPDFHRQDVFLPIEIKDLRVALRHSTDGSTESETNGHDIS